MPRTKASLTYRRTKNLRAVQLLLGHSKFASRRCATLASKLTTPWRLPNKLTCNRQRRLRRLTPPTLATGVVGHKVYVIPAA